VGTCVRAVALQPLLEKSLILPLAANTGSMLLARLELVTKGRLRFGTASLGDAAWHGADDHPSKKLILSLRSQQRFDATGSVRICGEDGSLNMPAHRTKL
jgi:hypothetical protein